ncbi:MAG: SH3 domain-containing protein [Thermoanaerobaculia bacterium]
MRFLLSLLLITTLACRENPSPESQAIVTAANETTATVAPAPVAPAVNGPKLMPVDEASSDPSLVAFRNDLIAAVRRGDVEAVVALADPNVRTSFGNGGGAAELRRMLAEGPLMKDLEQILPLGGKFMGPADQRTFWAPYVYSAWPEDRDAFTSLVVIGENIALRESPDANARIVATLSHDILEFQGEKPGQWSEVKTADGRTGWVEQRFVLSPVGYRAGFQKVDGRWRLRALVAGD